MKEDFLHYVWQYKKFDFSNLTTVSGESLIISQSGQYLKQAGPDFFNAQLSIGNQKWAGNIEIHVKSSDWYLHQHEKDVTYENVILHVVWEHDAPVFRKGNVEIPVLELKKYVSKTIVESYTKLAKPKSWIYCENEIKTLDPFIVSNWMERLFFERLERKSIPIEQLLSESENDWEAVLFCMMAKNFGLNTNGDTFLKVAKSIPFSIVRKECFEVENLEALFFGQANLLPIAAEDLYPNELKSRFDYLVKKYRLQRECIDSAQFFKHRPDNFPTIRLAQLAMLYHRRHNLFSKIILAKSLDELYDLFDVAVSSYWQTHYQYDKESPKKKKRFSKSFVDLLIINTIVPFQFAYARSQGKEISETTVALLQSIVAEKNNIIEKFANFGLKAKNAFETQSLLQLKNDYCNQGRCMQCSIGIQLIKT